MVRTATEQDLPALSALWQQVFGDEPAYSARVMREFAGLDNVYLDDEDGVSAMLTAIPVRLSGRPGAYFYAAATAPDKRGQGRMTALLSHARNAQMQKGRGFAVLVPASESLRGFYAARGFEPAFSLRTVRRTIRRNLWAVADFDTITGVRFSQVRRRFAPDAVQLPDAAMTGQILQLYSKGATTVETSRGYGIYFEEGDTLRFVELFADSDADAQLLLEAARDRTGCERATITLAGTSELFLGEGQARPYGMASFWAEKPELYQSYMNLMLE